LCNIVPQPATLPEIIPDTFLTITYENFTFRVPASYDTKEIGNDMLQITWSDDRTLSVWRSGQMLPQQSEARSHILYENFLNLTTKDISYLSSLSEKNRIFHLLSSKERVVQHHSDILQYRNEIFDAYLFVPEPNNKSVSVEIFLKSMNESRTFIFFDFTIQEVEMVLASLLST